MYLFPETNLSSPPLLPGQPNDPRFRVHETLLEQGSGRVNEDSLAIAETLSVVCDGATSLHSAQSKTAEMIGSGGQEAARITSSVFADAPKRDLLESVCRANELIRETMIDRGVDLLQRQQLWSTSFAAVQINGDSINWCQTGDCMIFLVLDDGSGHILTELPGQDRDVLKHWQQIGASAREPIHQALAREIGAVRRMMNREFGVLNGEKEALDFVSYGTLSDDRIAEVLLFSDGLFPPSATPDNPFDAELFLRLYESGGLTNVRDHVRSLQSTDPGCYRYPRFKRFDDISGIALKRY